MQLSSDTILGVGIGLLTAFLWAVSNNVYKSQSDEVKPVAVAAFKMWLTLCVMTILVFFPFRTIPFSMNPTSILFLAASVTVGLTIGDTLYLSGQERIGVAYAYPIVNAYPVTTYLFAIVLIAEEIVPLKFVGILIAVCGVFIIAHEQAESPQEGAMKGKRDLIGLAAVLIAMLCYSIGTIFLEIGVADVDPIDGNWIRTIVGSMLILPIFLGAKQKGMPTPSRRATKIVLVGAFFGMSIGSLLYTYTVKLIGSSLGSLLVSTTPLFGVPLSMTFLGEKLSRLAILGALITILGVIIVLISV
jgi:DME family drug/metabolite transporter